MTDLQTLVASARDDFGKQRVNKAVDSLIKALEIIAARDGVETAPKALTEPAPAPTATPLVEEAPKETTPADLARVLATQERSETEEPTPTKRKRAPAGTRTNDVASASNGAIVSS